jgi:hypothetical protein
MPRVEHRVAPLRCWSLGSFGLFLSVFSLVTFVSFLSVCIVGDGVGREALHWRFRFAHLHLSLLHIQTFLSVVLRSVFPVFRFPPFRFLLFFLIVV